MGDFDDQTYKPKIRWENKKVKHSLRFGSNLKAVERAG